MAEAYISRRESRVKTGEAVARYASGTYEYRELFIPALIGANNAVITVNTQAIGSSNSVIQYGEILKVTISNGVVVSAWYSNSSGNLRDDIRNVSFNPENGLLSATSANILFVGAYAHSYQYIIY